MTQTLVKQGSLCMKQKNTSWPAANVLQSSIIEVIYEVKISVPIKSSIPKSKIIPQSGFYSRRKVVFRTH